MGAQYIMVHHEALRRFVTDVLVRCDMRLREAMYCADCLVQTDLWGKDSHGVLRLPAYVERLRSGGINPRPAPHLVRGTGAFRVLDGDDGIGYVVGRNAMVRAVDLAAAHGIGMVGVLNSSHFGAAGLYARLATARDMIGIAMSNSVLKVVAPGGRLPVTGSNPLAIGIPSHGAFPFVLDMSLAAVAGGRLLLAAKKGEKIPTDWATDAHGRPTDDPQTAFEGFYLPAGGAKGLGMAYVLDILCGVITGANFGLETRSMYSSEGPTGTGHAMLAIDVGAVIDKETLTERMAAFFAMIKGSPTWDPAAELMIPGEVAFRTDERRRRSGIPLSLPLCEELSELGRKVGVRATFEST